MKKRVGRAIAYGCVVVLYVLTIIFEFCPIVYSSDPVVNRFLCSLIPPALGTIAVYLTIVLSGVKLFSAPKNLLYFLPCLLVALNNFPLFSYLNGNMEIVHNRLLDVLLFIGYCLAVGFFEEGIFRGLLFPAFAACFRCDKKGLWLSYLITSISFGIIHLLNLFSGAGVGQTLLQVGYSILTGGLFTFVLLKTKNLFLCAITHSLYNFCGLIFAENGLGNGVVFDAPTTICMAVVAVIVGGFVLISIAKYSQEEQIELYQKCGIKTE